jgi:hypothetical protein
LDNKTITEISQELDIGLPQLLIYLKEQKIHYKNERGVINDVLSKNLIKMYVEDKFSMKQIAKRFQISNSSVKLHLLKNDIEIRPDYSYGKKYILPSGNIINVRGFEVNFLDHIFQNNLLKEADIEKGIIFSYKFKGKSKKYYSDFYIKKLNLIIEVKSWYI